MLKYSTLKVHNSW